MNLRRHDTLTDQFIPGRLTIHFRDVDFSILFLNRSVEERKFLRAVSELIRRGNATPMLANEIDAVVGGVRYPRMPTKSLRSFRGSVVVANTTNSPPMRPFADPTRLW